MVGIIEVVKEVKKKRPSAHIVVNTILPRTNDPDALLNGTLWQDLVWINERIECYCQGTDGVEFYNATDLFVTEDGMHLNTTLFLDDGVHPDPKGMRAWGREIMEKVKDLM